MKVLIVYLIFLLKGFKFEKNFDIEKFIINEKEKHNKNNISIINKYNQ